MVDRSLINPSIMLQEQVVHFVESTRFSISNNGSRCVDGRYLKTNNLSALAKPGADAGDLMIAFAALNKLNNAVDSAVVLKAVLTTVGGPGQFHFHSDSHADAGVPGSGCGHLKQARLDPEAYGLTSSQIDFIFGELPGLLKLGARQEILQGDHKEQAVITVRSSDYTISPQAEIAGGMVQSFVYHETLDRKRLDELSYTLALALEFGESQAGLLSQAISDMAGMQLQETLRRLAGGLPAYVVAITTQGGVTIVD